MRFQAHELIRLVVCSEWAREFVLLGFGELELQFHFPESQHVARLEQNFAGFPAIDVGAIGGVEVHQMKPVVVPLDPAMVCRYSPRFQLQVHVVRGPNQ